LSDILAASAGADVAAVMMMTMAIVVDQASWSPYQQATRPRHICAHDTAPARTRTASERRPAAAGGEKTDRDSSAAPTRNHPPASVLPPAAAHLIRIKQR